MQMPFPVIRIDDPGGFVASCVIICAGLIKGAVELPEALAKLKRKKGKKANEPKPEPEPLKEEVEVISKEDFDDLLEEIKSAKQILTDERNENTDAIACLGVVNIILRIMEKRSTEESINIVENEIYSYLRHNEFPSKPVLIAMFEMSIEEARNQRRKEKDDLDSRSSN